jgi:hypothetical protein
MYSFSEKIGYITPSLCFQADVFYPNAIAAVKASDDNLLGEVPMGGGIIASGCRGNQIQRDFPLESRLPVAVPLIQYPSKTSEYFLDQMDLCAVPVLNWEMYIETLKITLKGTGTKFTDKR